MYSDSPSVSVCVRPCDFIKRSMKVHKFTFSAHLGYSDEVIIF